MRRWVWVVLLICSLGFIGGCSVSSDDGPGVEPEYDRTTPENLINFFADAYERQDLDKYDESLHDGFLFTFLPDDADSAGLPPDQPWWGKTEDVASARKLFDNAEVTNISMDLAVVTKWPTEDGFGFRLDPDVKVTVEKAGATEPLVLWVNNSWFDVEIVEDPYDTELWVFAFIDESLKEGLLADAGEQ